MVEQEPMENKRSKSADIFNESDDDSNNDNLLLTCHQVATSKKMFWFIFHIALIYASLSKYFKHFDILINQLFFLKKDNSGVTLRA